VLAGLVLLRVKGTGGVTVIAFAHAEVLVNDWLFAIIPPLGQERNGLAISDREKNVVRLGGYENALALVHVYEILLPRSGVLLDFDSGAIHQQDVFVKLRVTMITSNFAGFDELMRPLEDWGIGNKRKNGASAVPNGVQVTARLEGLHSHRRKTKQTLFSGQILAYQSSQCQIDAK
jgi:hypothetical protein